MATYSPLINVLSNGLPKDNLVAVVHFIDTETNEMISVRYSGFHEAASITDLAEKVVAHFGLYQREELSDPAFCSPFVRPDNKPYFDGGGSARPFTSEEFTQFAGLIGKYFEN